jgi:hypothetical protein
MRPCWRIGSIALLASLLAGACAPTAEQAMAPVPAANPETGSAGSSSSAPQQTFDANQTIRQVTPAQTRMLGPAAGGAAALSLVPGL